MAGEHWRRYNCDPLFVLGVGLYWGEGSKRDNQLVFTNSDPLMAAVWMRWCRRYARRGLDPSRIYDRTQDVTRLHGGLPNRTTGGGARWVLDARFFVSECFTPRH